MDPRRHFHSRKAANPETQSEDEKENRAANNSAGRKSFESSSKLQKTKMIHKRNKMKNRRTKKQLPLGKDKLKMPNIKDRIGLPYYKHSRLTSDALKKGGIIPRNKTHHFSNKIKPKKTEEMTAMEDSQRRIYFTLYSKVHAELNLRHQSLFLAMLIMDDLFFVNKMKGKSLSGVQVFTCFFLAVKFEEIYPPKYRKIALAFSIEETLAQYLPIEIDVLAKLNFDLQPRRGPFYFIHKFPFLQEIFKEASLKRSHTLYLLQLCAYESKLCRRFTWEQILETIELFLRDEIEYMGKIEECYRLLTHVKSHQSYRNPIFYKYAKPQYHYASTLPDNFVF